MDKLSVEQPEKIVYFLLNTFSIFSEGNLINCLSVLYVMGKFGGLMMILVIDIQNNLIICL